MVSSKDILEQATAIFKRDYSGLTAEAVICFLVAADLQDPTVGDIARAVGMTEPEAYHHITMLTHSGSGLVALANTGDGRNVVRLTPAGDQVKISILSVIG